MAKNVKGKYAKLCAVLFLIFLLCELTIRAFFHFTNKNIFFLASMDMDEVCYLYQRHPFLEHTLRPNAEFIHGDIKFRINSLGFRGKEFDPDDARPFRVFVLGGSSVFNALGGNNIPFCELLEDKLKRKYPGRNIEIVNAGVSGYTAFHSLVNLATRLLDYNPDAIIIYHSWNDIKTWPYLNRRFNYGRLWQEVYCRSQTLAPLKPLLDNSYTWLLIKASWCALDKFFFCEGKRKSPAEIYLKANEGDDINYGKSVYKRNVTNIIALAKKNKVQVLIINPLTLIKADNSEEERKHINYSLVHVPAEKLPQLMDEAGDILEEIALAETIPYIDLNKRIKQSLVYLVDHIHLTRQGNEAVAEYLTQQWDQIWGKNN